MESSKKHRAIEWGKNLLILFLTLSAFFLIGKSSFYGEFDALLSRNAARVQGPVQGETGKTVRQLSIQPVRLAVQNREGRYGVQYDQQTVNQLFETSLGSLLREALSGAQAGELVSESQWQGVLRYDTTWVYYDFMSDLPLAEMAAWLGREESTSALTGAARRFLLAKADGKSVLYYCGSDGAYYRSELSEGGESRLETITNEFEPNGAQFAFELPEQYGTLAPNVMILPTLPGMPIYEVKNPMEGLEEYERDAVLRAFSFNPRTASYRQLADGLAIQDGLDSLRILDSGAIMYHGKETEQPRYPVDGHETAQLLEATQELLEQLSADYTGEGIYYLMEIENKENESVTVTYGYRLNGAPVQVLGQGFGARFDIQGGAVCDFTIYVRQYTSTSDLAPILPERQAIAIMSALGQQGKEMQLAYLDTGESSRISVNWMAR